MIYNDDSKRQVLNTSLHHKSTPSDQRVQNAVLDHITNHPSVLTSPICSSLVQTVCRGTIPRSREDFEKFQIEFMRKCLEIARGIREPNVSQWLTQKISSTCLYDWDGIEEASQLATLIQTLEDPLQFVEHAQMLVETGRTRYLKDPNLTPLLKGSLILEQLIESAASSSDNKFRRFVKEFIVQHHLRSEAVSNDENMNWLSRQSEKDSPLLRFFQKVRVLDERNNLRFDVVSLNEAIKILKQLVKYESRLVEQPLDYDNLENLDRQLQELALKKFTVLFNIYRNQNPSDVYLVGLKMILEKDLSLEEKLAQLQEVLLNSDKYPPQLREVLTEIFCKDTKTIDQILEKQASEEGRLERLRVKPSMLWKIKESWNLEKRRHPGNDFIPYIKSLCAKFHSRCGLDLSDISLVRQFASFSILSEIFTDNLLEAIAELSLDAFYRELVILAFKNKNVDLLFRISDLVSYQKYLCWAKSLPEHYALRNKVLELDQKYKKDKLTCAEKIERTQFYLQMNSSSLTFEQKMDAISSLQWSEVHRSSLIMAYMGLRLGISNNATLRMFCNKEATAKKEMATIQSYKNIQMQSLTEDSPFKRFLQERGFFAKERTLLSSFLMDELSLLKEEFIKKMEYMLGIDLRDLSRSVERINDFASYVIFCRFQQDIYPDLPRDSQLICDAIFNSTNLSWPLKIEKLKAEISNSVVIDSLNQPITPKNFSQDGLLAIYQKMIPGTATSFLASLFSSMNLTIPSGESLEDYNLEVASFVQFVVNCFVKTSCSMGLDVEEELGLQDVLQQDFQIAEKIIQKNIWAQYQNKLKSLPKSEKGVSDLIKIGPEIAIEQSRNSITASTSLSPELKKELLKILSFESRIEEIHCKVEESLLWIKNKAHLYHLPIPEEEFSPERTFFQKWKTVKTGLGLFSFHMKKRIEEENLSSDYICYLEATLFSQSLNSSDLLLSEIEEQMPDWPEHL